MGTADTITPDRVALDGGDDADEGGENVLVLADSMSRDADEHCAAQLGSADAAPAPNLLLVSLDDTPDSRFDAVVRRGPGRPANVAVVCADETRGAAAARQTGAPGVDPGPWTATVSSPADLTGLGVRIEQVISAWADGPEPVVLCFHSLTTLCQYVDDRAAFRFCHTVTRHLDSVGASSHFHLDPAAVDDRTVATLSALFDRVEDYT
jgi:hypothetical protein